MSIQGRIPDRVYAGRYLSGASCIVRPFIVVRVFGGLPQQGGDGTRGAAQFLETLLEALMAGLKRFG